MKLRNGVHTNRIIDINPEATLAIAQRNASSSPFLRLPLEVRDMIYKYAFGGDLIHIIENPVRGAAYFQSSICRASISEEEAQENFNNETVHKWIVPANEDRHSRCRLWNIETFGNGEQRPEIVRLSALRCCRQIYNEAHYVPYSANTLSFDDPRTLQRFLLSLRQGSHDNHLAIRSLFIEIFFPCYITGNTAYWKRTLSTCANHFRNLTNVNIDLEWKNWHWRQWPRNPAEFEPNGNWDNFVMSDLSVFSVFTKLPLQSATLVFSDDDAYPWFSGANADRWTLEEKQDWARYIKKVILKQRQLF